MNLRKSLDTCLDMKKLCAHIFSENGGGGSRNREKKRKLIERRWPKTFHKFWIIHGMVQHILFCTYMSTFKKISNTTLFHDYCLFHWIMEDKPP